MIEMWRKIEIKIETNQTQVKDLIWKNVDVIMFRFQ